MFRKADCHASGYTIDGILDIGFVFTEPQLGSHKIEDFGHLIKEAPEFNGVGLKTRESSAVAYDKGNSLAENAVGRVRPLACSLMHQVSGRLDVQLGTSSAI